MKLKPHLVPRHALAGKTRPIDHLPSFLDMPFESVIVASVSYTYSSPIGHLVFDEPWELDEIFYLRPRRTNQVVYNP